MPYSVIALQEETFIEIKGATGGTLYTQPYSRAVNVAPYQSVTPWVRIKADPFNSITAKPTIKFKFLTAAILLNPAETGLINAITSASPFLGDRFYPYGSSGEIEINEVYNSTSPGKTYTLGYGADNRTLASLTNPGGLMIYQIENTSTADAKFRFDIYLVCRGPA